MLSHIPALSTTRMNLDSVVMRRTLAAFTGAAAIGMLLLLTVMSDFSTRMLCYDAVVLLGGAGGSVIGTRLPGANGRARIGALAGTLLSAIGGALTNLLLGGGGSALALATLLGCAMAVSSSLVATDDHRWSVAPDDE